MSPWHALENVLRFAPRTLYLQMVFFNARAFMKHLAYLLLLIQSCALLPVSEQRMRSEEEFPLPASLFDDSIVVAMREPPEDTIPLSPKRGVISGDRDEVGVFETVGWRVQIKATKNSQESEQIRRQAEAKLQERIYVNYEPPYYRIRVGDCSSFEDATRLLRRVKAKGYDEAFIVRTNVLIRKTR